MTAIPSSSDEEYQLCSLSPTQSDIEKWAEFCASVFRHKSNPPSASYFERHFHNDPRADAALVRLVQLSTNHEIVSTVRIFKRTLCLGSDSVVMEAGGIGEVGTSPDHRRRGLSQRLLHDALSIMNTDGTCSSTNAPSCSVSCSLLHASTEFRPLYAKVGSYASVTSHWSLLPLRLDKLMLSQAELSGTTNHDFPIDHWKIRQAIFPRDTPQLHALHKSYSEDRFITIQQSQQYWNQYVSRELGETLWILTRETSLGQDEEQILGWMALRQRGNNRFQLREFGTDRNLCATTTSWVFERLLGIALHQAFATTVPDWDMTCPNHQAFLLHLPTPVLSDILPEQCLFLAIDEVVQEDDDGWMYVHFDKSMPSVFELTTRKVDPIPHLIWPTDSF